MEGDHFCIDGYRGSVLGRVLFLIFINDLDSGLLNSISEFADGTKLFAKVNADTDREIIRKDLHQQTEWSNSTADMSFNRPNARS